MKKKQLKSLIFAILSSVLCLSFATGCGKEEEPVQIEVVSADVIGIEESTVTEEVVEEEPEEEPEVLPDGMVRSPLSNEIIPVELANQRPVAVMIPMDQCAQPDFNNSKADVMYEALVEGSITRTMCVIQDWQDLDKIGNIRSTRAYFIYWSWEWDAILLHDGGPAIYITDLLNDDMTNNISGRGYRDSSRSAPHNEYYTADIVNENIDSFGYQREHRENFVPQHFNFVSYGGQADLAAKYEDAKEVYVVDFANCYPVTKSRFEYNPEDGLYYRYIYDEPHMDCADPDNPVQLAFNNIIVQRCIGGSLDDHDYRALECHKTTEDGWYITNGHAIHITWQKTGNTTPTRYFDDFGNEIQISTGKTMICVLQDGGSGNLDLMFRDSNGNNVDCYFNR